MGGSEWLNEGRKEGNEGRKEGSEQWKVAD